MCLYLKTVCINELYLKTQILDTKFFNRNQYFPTIDFNKGRLKCKCLPIFYLNDDASTMYVTGKQLARHNRLYKYLLNTQAMDS